MNAKEIDELLEAFIDEDLEKIIKLADIEIIDDDIGNFCHKNKGKILKILVTKIEQGDYDYFYSKIDEKRYRYFCIDLLCVSSKVEDIKEILERREELNLGIYDLIELIKATRDIEYIKEIIENKEKREELNFDSYDLVKLIKATRDIEYIKEIIEDKEKRKQLGLQEIEVCDLIIETKDTEYIKEIIEDKEKRKELRIRYDLCRLIQATRDSEYIKGIIEDSEKREELELDGYKLRELIKATKDSEYINNFLKSVENKQNTENSNQIINLPNNMTIGIEIESEGINSKLISNDTLFATGWKCIRDGSLVEGIEVVSPVLSGNTEETSEAIKYVCRRLNELRSNCICEMWWAYTYWSRLLDNGRKLEKLN